MSTETQKGVLYRLDLDKSLHVLVEGIGCSNGMAFTSDTKGFYHTDSFAREIYHFDYSIEDGGLSNRRVFVRFDPTDGMPDGLTRDSDGNLWSALWDGAAVAQISTDGRQEKRISIPTPKVSSVAFGGQDYTDLYITTAGGNIRPSDGPVAGGLFRTQCEVAGVAEFVSRIGLS